MVTDVCDKIAELDDGDCGLASEMEDRGVWLLEDRLLRFLRLRLVGAGLGVLFSSFGAW
jgi:hypothetical protein